MINRSWLICAIALLQYCALHAQKKDISYYLPKIQYDQNIYTPEDVLGYQVGDWHVTHDQLIKYMEVLAEQSDRVTMAEYARSHEHRPLVTLTITSPKNHANLDQIKKDHLTLSDPTKFPARIEDQPVVIYQGYTIHGNESSGSNAALLVAYYLAAGQDAYLDKLLDNAVIILDPCYNPDGLHRFSTWVNMHKSRHMTGDPESRELNEVWPGGRTNHYWFDLNRDWLLLAHPESRGRVRLFHDWKPNVLTDHHEMGSNSTFFFMPGIPSRTNPMTPAINQELTGDLALYHAAALDSIGSSYYTKESFDDYYHGKGSTYPDANGCVGILFEQASSRGHLHETDNGVIDFAFTIRNQVVTSLSTHRGALAHREKLLRYQRDFYHDAPTRAKKDPVKAYQFSAPADAPKLKRFIELLDIHDIAVYQGDQPESFVVPTDQAQYTMIKTIFEPQFGFTDSLFYDVSAWTVPMALDISYQPVKRSVRIASDRPDANAYLKSKQGKITDGVSSVGYILDWRSMDAPAALYQIQNRGLITRMSDESFSIETTKKVEKFSPGSILIPTQNQALEHNELYDYLKHLTAKYDVNIYGLATGMSSSGLSFGARSHNKLSQPSVGIIGGYRTNSYEVGAAWYVFDLLADMPVTVIDQNDFNINKLHRYNVLIMTDGAYTLNAEKVKAWVNAGGTLIVMKRAINWARSNIAPSIKIKTGEKEKPRSAPLHYCNVDEHTGAQVTGGVILRAMMDQSHPLCFGTSDDEIYFMRRGNLYIEPTNNAYATPIRYTKNAVASGYMSKANQSIASESAAVTVHGVGSGRVIAFADNPNFRGYWWGGMRIFLNAVFFGDVLDGRTVER